MHVAAGVRESGLFWPRCDVFACDRRFLVCGKSGITRPSSAAAASRPPALYTDARPILSAFAISDAPSPCAFMAFTWAASIEAGRPLYTPAALAFAIPSSWRSRRRFVSNSANTPSMSRKHLPAAVLVSIGCSVAFNEAPRARTARTMSCRSPMLRARRAIRVTVSKSPSRRKSSTVRIQFDAPPVAFVSPSK
jgi:hypothetical protein